jgi:predicted O-methyltransferase YrrM
MATNYDSLVRELAHLKVEYQGESSWYEHGSFMIWLVGTLKPDTFVELGSHYGYSYFAACQQKHLQLIRGRVMNTLGFIPMKFMKLSIK